MHKSDYNHPTGTAIGMAHLCGPASSPQASTPLQTISIAAEFMHQPLVPLPVCHTHPSPALCLLKIPSSTPQMGTHVQPAYVKQLFRVIGGYMEGGREWRRERLGGVGLSAFCGDIMRQSFSEHN